MKNFSGFLKKILFSLFSSCIFCAGIFVDNKIVYAQDVDLETELEVVYSVEQAGALSVEVDVNITTASKYPTILNGFSLNLPFKNITNLSAETNSKPLHATYQEQNERSLVIIDFAGAVVSKSSPINGILRFKIPDFVENTKGEIHKFYFPLKFSDNTTLRDVKIRWAKSFGETSFYIPTNLEIEQNKNEYMIDLESPTYDAVILFLGDSIAYDFMIEKTLRNPGSSSSVIMETNIPKKQHNQEVFISNMSPIPDSAYIDQEGNMFASYSIPAQTSITVNISGTVLMEDSQYENTLSLKERKQATNSIGYWKINDEKELSRLTLFLRESGIFIEQDNTQAIIGENTAMQTQLYNAITKYVQKRLEIKSGNASNEDEIRLGATAILKHRDSATPNDYADLLIALLREYNLPSRMVEGYVCFSPYDFPNGKGFHHTWVEVWNGGWKILDPFLAELYADSNISDKDLEKLNQITHLAIVTRTITPVKPNLHISPDDKTEYTYASTISDSFFTADVQSDIGTIDILIPETTGNITVHNNGNVIINSVKSTGLIRIQGVSENLLILPGMSKTFNTIALSTDLLTASTKNSVVISNLNGDIIEQKIILPNNITGHWWLPWLSKSISFFLFSIVLLVLYFTYYNVNKIMRRKKKAGKVVEFCLGVLFLFSFYSIVCLSLNTPKPVYAVDPKSVDNDTGTTESVIEEPQKVKQTETSELTAVNEKYYDINVTVGTQSVWNNTVPVTVVFTPRITSENTEVSWDHCQGIEIEEKYTNYFRTEKDKSYTVRINIKPINAGVYKISANVTGWTDSNYTTSEDFQVIFDENLLSQTNQDQYRNAMYGKYAVFAILGIVGLILLTFGGKVLFDKLRVWLKPIEY